MLSPLVLPGQGKAAEEKGQKLLRQASAKEAIPVMAGLTMGKPSENGGFMGYEWENHRKMLV